MRSICESTGAELHRMPFKPCTAEIYTVKTGVKALKGINVYLACEKVLKCLFYVLELYQKIDSMRVIA